MQISVPFARLDRLSCFYSREQLIISDIPQLDEDEIAYLEICRKEDVDGILHPVRHDVTFLFILSSRVYRLCIRFAH